MPQLWLRVSTAIPLPLRHTDRRNEGAVATDDAPCVLFEILVPGYDALGREADGPAAQESDGMPQTMR